VQIQVNGAQRAVDDGLTVGRLVALVTGTEVRQGFAAAVNGEVVPRSRWDEVRVVDGDEVEIAAPFQGG
jgi:sulfur carrier protein